MVLMEYNRSSIQSISGPIRLVLQNACCMVWNICILKAYPDNVLKCIVEMSMKKIALGISVGVDI